MTVETSPVNLPWFPSTKFHENVQEFLKINSLCQKSRYNFEIFDNQWYLSKIYSYFQQIPSIVEIFGIIFDIFDVTCQFWTYFWLFWPFYIPGNDWNSQKSRKLYWDFWPWTFNRRLLITIPIPKMYRTIHFLVIGFPSIFSWKNLESQNCYRKAWPY